MKKDWLEHELRNWARWCRSGPEPGPVEPSRCGLDYLQDERYSDADDKPPPIHIDNAKLVQRVFDSSIKIEKKVLQAEYVSPWQYDRYSGGISAAVLKLKKDIPGLSLSESGYEMILASMKRRVERAFQ